MPSMRGLFFFVIIGFLGLFHHDHTCHFCGVNAVDERSPFFLIFRAFSSWYTCHFLWVNAVKGFWGNRKELIWYDSWWQTDCFPFPHHDVLAIFVGQCRQGLFLGNGNELICLWHSWWQLTALEIEHKENSVPIKPFKKTGWCFSGSKPSIYQSAHDVLESWSGLIFLLSWSTAIEAFSWKSLASLLSEFWLIADRPLRNSGSAWHNFVFLTVGEVF